MRKGESSHEYFIRVSQFNEQLEENEDKIDEIESPPQKYKYEQG